MLLDAESRLAALAEGPPYRPAPVLDHPHGLLWGARFESRQPPPRPALEEQGLADDTGALPQRLAGRAALREAVRALTRADPGPIGRTPRGAPALPLGVAGSITHKDGLALALAATGHGWQLGLDLEAFAPDRASIAPRVLREEEVRAITGLSGEERWLQILARFSLKEAVYKAVDPHLQRYVRFTEVSVALPAALPRGAVFPVAIEPHFEPGTPVLEVDATCALVGRWVLSTARARVRS